MVMLGSKVNCANPLNKSCWLNRGLISEYGYIPGLSNESQKGAGLSNNCSIVHDLAKLPCGSGREGTDPSTGINWGRHAVIAGGGGKFTGPNRPGGLGKTWFNSAAVAGWMLAGNFNTANVVQYQFSKTTKFAGFAWIRLTTVGTKQTVMNCEWENSISPLPGWGFSADTKLYFQMMNEIATAGRSVSTAGTVFAINKWYHVGFSYDGSNTAAGITLYVNGVKQTGLTTVLDTDPGTLAGIHAQAWHGNSVANLSGYGDQVRIYGREVFPYEARELYKEVANGGPNLYNYLEVPVGFTGPPATITAATGVYTITGVNAGFTRPGVITAVTATYTITGINVVFRPIKLIAQTASYVLTGIDVRLKPSTFFAQTTAYVLTWKAVILKRTRIFTAGTGSFTLTGRAATLTKGKQVIAAVATYSLTGIAAALRATRKFTAVKATYLLTAQAAVLKFGHKLPAAATSYTLTGVAAVLRRGRTLAAAVGTYVFTRIAANLLYKRVLNAETRSYGITAFDVGVFAGRKFLASTVSFTLVGQAAVLTPAKRVVGVSQSYVLTGMAVGLKRQHAPFPAVTVSYVLTGKSVILTVGRPALSAQTANLTLNGIGAVLQPSRRIQPVSRPFVLSSPSVALIASRSLSAAYGTSSQYVITGRSAGSVHLRNLLASSVSYVLVGKEVGLSFGQTGIVVPQRQVVAQIDFSPLVKTKVW
jgi:hypothetical protein